MYTLSLSMSPCHYILSYFSVDSNYCFLFPIPENKKDRFLRLVNVFLVDVANYNQDKGILEQTGRILTTSGSLFTLVSYHL